MQLLTTPHPARGVAPSHHPRRLLHDLELFHSQCTVNVLPSDTESAVPLNDVCVGMAYRFLRIGGDTAAGFSVWRPIYGAESDSCSVVSPVQLSMFSPAAASHDPSMIVALSFGDVLTDSKHRVHDIRSSLITSCLVC